MYYGGPMMPVTIIRTVHKAFLHPDMGVWMIGPFEPPVEDAKIHYIRWPNNQISQPVQVFWVVKD